MTNRKIRYTPIQPEIVEMAAEHGNSAEAMLEVLHDIQAERGGLSQTDLTDAARAIGGRTARTVETAHREQSCKKRR